MQDQAEKMRADDDELLLDVFVLLDAREHVAMHARRNRP